MKRKTVTRLIQTNELLNLRAISRAVAEQIKKDGGIHL